MSAPWFSDWTAVLGSFVMTWGWEMLGRMWTQFSFTRAAHSSPSPFLAAFLQESTHSCIDSVSILCLDLLCPREVELLYVEPKATPILHGSPQWPFVSIQAFPSPCTGLTSGSSHKLFPLPRSSLQYNLGITSFLWLPQCSASLLSSSLSTIALHFSFWD